MNVKKLAALILLASATAFFVLTDHAAEAAATQNPGDKRYENTSIDEGKGVEEEFTDSVKRVLARGDDLKLSDGQVDRIKSLMADVKKRMIKQNADIQALTVEINTMSWEAPFDVGEVNELVSEKYHLQKEKAQYLVSAYSRLSKILTDEQREKAGLTGLPAGEHI